LHSIITASDGVITLSCTISLWLLPKWPNYGELG
jgi:hypothetical protein